MRAPFRGDGRSASTGSLSFQPHADSPTSAQPVAVAVGDVNRDGKPDLVTANSGASTVSVLLGQGNGTFQAHVDYGAGPNPGGVAIGDVTRDGIPDLAVANSGTNTVSVLWAKATAPFRPTSTTRRG